MVALIDQDELELAGVELADPVAGGDGLYGRNGDVGRSRGLRTRHFDLDTHVRVVLLTVPSGLLDKLLAVDENEGLRGVWGSGVSNPFDQLSENDGFATPGRQRDAHSPVAEVDMLEDGLYAFFLIVSQLEWTGSGSGSQRTEVAEGRTWLSEGPGKCGKGATSGTHLYRQRFWGVGGPRDSLSV